MRNGKKGFTLVETICALALLVMVVSGFLTLAVAASQMNNRAKEMSVAFEQATADLAERKNVSVSNATVEFTVNGTTCPVNVTLWRTREKALAEFGPKN